MNNLIFNEKETADAVLSTIKNIIKEHGFATIADIFSQIDEKDTTWIDNEWGWDDLSNVKIREDRSRYIIDLPEPILLSISKKKFDNYFYPNPDDPRNPKNNKTYVDWLVEQLEKFGYDVTLKDKPKTLKIMFVNSYDSKKLDLFVDKVCLLLNQMDLNAVSFLENTKVEVSDGETPQW